jgi:N4-gp56 family major capsid protein
MAVTDVGQLDNAAVVKYQQEYLRYASEDRVWSQFVNWASIARGGGGTTFDWPILEPMKVNRTPLVSTQAITAVQLADSNVTLTPYEYGNKVTRSSVLEFQTRGDVRSEIAQVVGENQKNTVEMVCRAGILANTWVYRPNDNIARTGLDTTSDKITWAYLTQLVSLARAQGIRPFKGDSYAAIVPHELEPDILTMAEVKDVMYRKPEIMFNGEFAQAANIHFISSRYGKIYLSGGATAQAATTLNGAVSAGATSITVTDATGLAAGNWIVVGALETADTEQVQITAVNGSDLTILGRGNAAGNFGLMYAHANGAAVLEAANVAAIPIVGANSLKGIYAGETGLYGRAFVGFADQVEKRLLDFGWVWYGGIGIVQKFIIRGEVAIATGHLGDNFGP